MNSFNDIEETMNYDWEEYYMQEAEYISIFSNKRKVEIQKDSILYA